MKTTTSKEPMIILNNERKARRSQKRTDANRISMDISPERVLNELARIAFSSAAAHTRIVRDTSSDGTITTHIELIPTDNMSEDVKSTIVSIRDTKEGIRVETADKFRALELLGKHYGLFSDRSETTMQLNISDEDRALLERVGHRHALDN